MIVIFIACEYKCYDDDDDDDIHMHAIFAFLPCIM